MGSLIFPKSSRIYIDTQIVVYTVEKHPIFSPLLRDFWEAINSGAVGAFTSEMTILESLVHPLRQNDNEIAGRYEEFLHQPAITLAPISSAILRDAAKLRSQHKRLRTPDAIHLATALACQCDHLLTNDLGLRGLAGIHVSMLADQND